MAEKIGIYVCHCGSNIAGTVDVEEVARWAGKNIDGRRGRQGLQVHVLVARPADDRGGHQGAGPHRRGRGRLLAAPAREDLPQGLQERRPEPLPLPDDQPPRARLLGQQRQGRRHREGQGPDLGRRRAGQASAAARADAGRGQPGHAGRRRRHRRPPGHARTGRRRIPRLSGRARAVDRRPHGPVRQDLPHAGLLGLHPHAEDVRGRPAREHHAADLLRVGGGQRLGGQLQGQDPQEGPLRRRRQMHRLRHLHRKVPAARSSTTCSRPAWATARRSTRPSRRPCPAYP